MRNQDMEENYNPADDNDRGGAVGGARSFTNHWKKSWQKYLVPGLSVMVALFVLWWLLGSGNGVVVAGKNHNEKTANQPSTSADNAGADGPMTPSSAAPNGGGVAGGKESGDKTRQKSVPDIAVLNLTAADYQPKLLASGVTLPIQVTTLKSAVAGRIEKKLVAENQGVKAGTPLIQFAIEANMDKLVAAQKQLRLLEITRNSEGQLARQGLSSALNMAQVDANLAQARANVSQLKQVVNELKVKAPFDGALTQYQVEIGDLIGPGQPLAVFAALQQMYIQLYVSADQAKDLAVGATAQVTIVGEPKTAMVDYVGVVSDAQTGTLQVKLKIDNSDRKIKGQVPATVVITLPTVKAYRIPPTALSLNDDGMVGVKILGEGNKVMFVPVTILAQDANSSWVRGLPDKVTLLTDGQAFVSSGQVINPVYKNKQSN